ncbi:MAG: hypothetical protein HN712_14810 [Gemmatimonadetes bacterium]|nr:hypothetical protein [Gemmatimonadota bacterium]MBT7861589.1 hypothetical protein [Gemmatimonadota bacterium]
MSADGSFELSLTGQSPEEETFVVHLDMTPEEGFFGYGISGNPSSASQPAALPPHVYQISVPVESQQLRTGGTWTSTDSSLLLSLNELEISHVNDMAIVDYVTSLVHQELEREALADEARTGYSAALERVSPILIQQDEPLEEISWGLSINNGVMAISDPNGKFTGNWHKAADGTAVEVTRWANVKIGSSP